MKHFKQIQDYCASIQISPPKHAHFDIRSFENNMKTVVKQMPPFRHEFYAIAIKSEGGGSVKTGEFVDFTDGASIFFNSPFQVLSWDILPDWKGYYLMFSQDFIAQSVVLTDLLQLFPFLKIDQSIPFAIPDNQLQEVLQVFETIWKEYNGTEPDKMKLIEAQVFLLLSYVKRFFEQQIDVKVAEKSLKAADLKLLSRYQQLIESSFYPEVGLEKNANPHSTRFYAEKLSVHPNHLNAIVKAVSGVKALSHIHNHILSLAKSYLAQTSWSVKEVAYRLHFESPNAFSTFFKKHTHKTPLAYRKDTRL